MINDRNKQLWTQLGNIADSLRGKMNANESWDYCLGFIFDKYLSERQYLDANEILTEEKLDDLLNFLSSTFTVLSTHKNSFWSKSPSDKSWVLRKIIQPELSASVARRKIICLIHSSSIFV